MYITQSTGFVKAPLNRLGNAFYKDVFFLIISVRVYHVRNICLIVTFFTIWSMIECFVIISIAIYWQGMKAICDFSNCFKSAEGLLKAIESHLEYFSVIRKLIKAIQA